MLLHVDCPGVMQFITVLSYVLCSIHLTAAGALINRKPGDISKRTDVAPGIELRILPLGDSITWGYLSSDGNGYRLDLENDLSGSDVEYIGSQQSGTMANNENEGHPGATISQIAVYAEASLPERPNIVLLHAGTNDMNLSPPPEPYDQAPERLASLIDEIINACPDAALLVAQIIHAGNAATDARIQTFNAAIPGIVQQRVNSGHHVMTVDMSSVTASDLVDGLHPSDEGYNKMATLWFGAIQQAASEGWIHAPVTPSSTAGRTECLSGQFWYPAENGQDIASGVGHGGDGLFHNDWIPQGEIASGLGLNASGVVFADVDGDGRDDYLWVNSTNGAVIAYLNRWGEIAANWIAANGGNPIASGVGPGAGVFFADMNGDSKADYLLVDNDTGAVQMWLNGGPQSDGTWLWIGPTTIATGVPGAHWDTLIFADINGDNRTDYIVKDPKTGALQLWLNIGSPDSADITWLPYNEIASGLGTPNITLADLNGDGRADYLIWDNDGGLTGYLNIRGQSEGQPIWISSGGAKSIATGVGVPPTLIRMADIDGDGRADYCILNATTGAVQLYLNRGTADASVTGDGVRFKDIDGDGLDDYVFIDENGALTVYLNGGPNSDANLGWLWYPTDGGQPIANGAGATRSQVHLAYIDADHRADFVIIDPVTGAATCYLNGGPNSDANLGWIWYPQGEIASGLGPGEGVRFADIDGDGRDDYLWLNEEGAVIAYRNQVGLIAPNWIPFNDGNPIASGVGGYRKDIQFNDFNGDGRDDYLWVHPENGAVDVWINEVDINPANWVSAGQVASGVGFSGACIEFAMLDHTGRAAYVPVVPGTGAISAWLNGCTNPAPPSGGSGSGSPGSGGGSGGSGSGSGGSGIVFIDPSIWGMSNPTVSCEPPCVFVFPPFPLGTTTTITFPLYTTSLEVAWSTADVVVYTNGQWSSSAAYARITETTVITIPPVTTTEIELWNYNMTISSTSSRSGFVPIFLTSSVEPPLITTTDNPDPLFLKTSNPPVTRTITPPPYPWHTTSIPDPRFPTITFSEGTPGPLCRSGCGIQCAFFCDQPCLLDCGPNSDFNDPEDPDPPPPPPGNQGSNPSDQSEPTSEPTSSPTSTADTADFTQAVDSWQPLSQFNTAQAAMVATQAAEEQSQALSCQTIVGLFSVTGTPCQASPGSGPGGGTSGGSQPTSNGGSPPSSSPSGFPSLGTSSVSVPPDSVPSPCGPGILCSVSPPSSIPSSPPPSPSPAPLPKIQVGIGYDINCEPSGGGEGTGAMCAAFPEIFAQNDLSGTYDGCSTPYSSSTNQLPSTQGPTTPVTFGPFPLPSRTNCYFAVESDSDPGKITCDNGVASTSCSVDNTGRYSCNGANEYVPWRICVVQ